MAYQIAWSAHALEELKSIHAYLMENWTLREMTRFYDALESRLKIISSFPLIYPSTLRSPSVRRCVISKQVTLYYRVQPERITIISIFDSRQSPEKLLWW